MSKYYRCYLLIVNNRINNPLSNIYTESHHIIPRSLGGSNAASNLVDLSAKEHFLCHYLLTKCYNVGSTEWYKMQHAFMIMAVSSNGKRYFNSRLYEANRKNFSIVMSHNQQGSKNSQYGKIWITNISLERNQKINSNELSYWLSIGWTRGRIQDFLKRKMVQPKSKSDINFERNKEKAIHLFELYRSLGCQSIGEFIKQGHYNHSKVSLTKLWKKFIPEYSEKVQKGKPLSL